MYDDLNNLQYSLVWDYKYDRWFQDYHFQDKTLSSKEREEFITVINETVEQFSEGLPFFHNELERIKDFHDEYHELDRVILTVSQFVLITMIDCMVASKYFLLADRNYDKRFMRGKLMVIINEGFKKLYGFEEKTKKESKWNRLSPYMKHFSNQINQQYIVLTTLLEKHARSSSWWKEVRDLETHLDADKLYVSREKEIKDGSLMMESLKLFDTLFAVNHFLANLNACLTNYLLDKYHKGELTE